MNENRVRGEDHHASRLNSSKIMEIRKFLKDGFSLRDIAAWYDVSNNCIFRISHRLTWRHVQ